MKKYFTRYNVALLVLLLVSISMGVYYLVYLYPKDQPNELFVEAESLETQQKYNEALVKYSESINKNPQYTDSYIKAANILLIKNQDQEAIDLLKKGIGFAKNQSIIHQKIASIYALQPNYEEAVSWILKAREFDDGISQKRDHLSYLFLKDPVNAQENISLIDGSSDYAKYLQAIAYADDIEKATEHANSFKNNQEPKYQALFQAIENARNTEDNDIEDLMNVAKVAIENGEGPIAIRLLDKVIELNAYYEGSYIYKGYVYFEFNDNEKAINYLETAKNQKRNEEGMALLAMAYLRNNNLEKAKEVSNQLLTLNPQKDTTRWTLYEVFWALEEYTKASDQLENIVADQEEYRYVYAKGDLLLRQEKYKEAQEYLESLIKKANLNQKQKGDLIALESWANFNLGDKAKAKEALLDAETLYPTNAFVKLYLGLIAEQLNNPEEALNYYNMALELDYDGIVTIQARLGIDNLTKSE